MEDDKEISTLREEFGKMRQYVEDQAGHAQKHFEKLEEMVESMSTRVTKLEAAKIYFDGAKYGFGLAIVSGTAAIVGAAIWIISKLNPTGP